MTFTSRRQGRRPLLWGGRLRVSARPHDLRHSFGTEAARVANGNLVLVAQLMGHASISTTQRYIGWTPAGADVVNQLHNRAG